MRERGGRGVRRVRMGGGGLVGRRVRLAECVNGQKNGAWGLAKMGNGRRRRRRGVRGGGGEVK